MKDKTSLLRQILGILGIIILILALAWIIVSFNKWALSSAVFGLLLTVMCHQAIKSLMTQGRKNIIHLTQRLLCQGSGIDSDAGIIQAYENETKISPEEWDRHYLGAKKTIDLMGHGMHKVLHKKPDIFKKALEKGCSIRIILFSPDSLQAREAGERLTPGENLRQKIKQSLQAANDIEEEAAVKGWSGRISVKITTQVMYSKISRFDDYMVVTGYSNSDEPGDTGPSIKVRSSHDSGDGFWYNFYIEEFERMWRKAVEYRKGSPVSILPAGKRIYRLYQPAEEFRRAIIMNNDSPIPLPFMAIIYPTYKCNLNCDYCTCRKYRSVTNPLSMPPDIFEKILTDLAANGIRNIELSGGGEPLAHENIESFLGIVRKFRENNKVKFGLLTNGLNLTEEIAPLISNNFSYIRMTFAEGIFNSPDKKNRFLKNLDNMIKLRDTQIPHKIRIGIKILLTASLIKKNPLNMIHQVLDYNIDHLKIKTVNDDSNVPTEQEIENIKPKLFEVLHRCNIEAHVDIDRFKVSQQFQCWFGACIVVIDPMGHVYPCINYHNQPGVDTLANVGSLAHTGTIKDFWEPRRLRKFLQFISPHACNHKNSVSCRFAKYQQQMTEYMTLNVMLQNVQDQKTISEDFNEIEGFF